MNKRILLGGLALLLLLVLLWWQSQPTQAVEASPTPVLASTAPVRAAMLESSKSATPAAVVPPTQTPVRASESPPPANVNEWGVIEFTDGVPVVRTLASGSTCVIIPTVIESNGAQQIHLEMIVEEPGSLHLSESEIEALRGPAAKNFIRSEMSAARQDPSKAIQTSPSITAIPGHEVQLSVGSGRDLAMSLRLTPAIAHTVPGH